MFCIVVMEIFGCADFVSNPGAEYSIYGIIMAPEKERAQRALGVLFTHSCGRV